VIVEERYTAKGKIVDSIFPRLSIKLAGVREDTEAVTLLLSINLYSYTNYLGLTSKACNIVVL
jgi:hypothetical protein